MKPNLAPFGDFLNVALSGGVLTVEQSKRAMGLMLDGKTTEAQIGAFLACLHLRGEAVSEIIGCAQALRERARQVKIRRTPLLDTCGTGGDGAGTFNISTTVAFIAAGAGAAVAKHGNRAVSSRAGSADVLEALGVKTDLSAERTTACVETAGVGFLFAPSYHPGMARVGPVRRQLAVRTIFNLLGPLVNPARATHQLIGVYSTSLVRPLAEALMALGSRRAMVVSSDDGLDEISLSGRTQMAILHNGRVRVEAITPEAVGLRVRPSSALAGGDAKTNARIMRDILLGKKGAPREVSALNAAAALIVAGLARNWKEGLSLAFDSIDSGRAKKSLDALIEMTRGQ